MIKLKRFAGAGGSRPPHLGLRPIVLGGLLLIALLYNNVVRKTPYPIYW
jgi:hypothetical protein